MPRISLDELVATVVRHNAGLLAAERMHDAAAAQVTGARALPNPTLQYSRGSQRPLLAATGNAGYVQTVGVSQLIENPVLRRARVDAALSDERASRDGVQVTRNELVAQTLLGAYTLLLREAEAEAAAEAMALLQQVNGRVRARVDSGEAPRYELIKADAEVVSARSQYQTAQLLAEQAAIDLNRLAAGALPERWALNATLIDASRADMTGDFDTWKSRVDAGNPELRVLQAELDGARARLAGAQAERWPGVTLSLAQSRDPDARQHSMGVSVQIPLFDRRTGPVAAAGAVIERSRVRLDGRRAELSQQLLHVWRSLEMAQLRVLSLSQGAVPDAEAALRVADAAYRFGERGILDVLDAQRVLRAVRAELLVARFQVQQAQIELDLLSGRWANESAASLPR